MNELLTRGIGHTEFRESELGLIPTTWEIKSLGECCETQLGKALHSKKQTGEASLPYLRNVNLQWNGFDLEDLKFMDIFPEEYEQFTLQRGDLLVTEGGEPGRCSVWERDDLFAFQNAIHRLRTNESISVYYLKYQIEFLAKTGFLNGFFTQTSITHFNQESLRSVPISVPSLGEQEKVAEILTSLDDQIESVESKLVQLESLKKSLMGDLLTGRVRVSVD